VGPKIQMTPFGMMLSCGATIVDISAAGVTIDAPVFEMSAAEMIFDGGSIILAAGGTAVIDAPLITAQGTFGITGSLSVTEFLTTQNLLAGQIESL
jgi:hypothetical protein